MRALERDGRIGAYRSSVMWGAVVVASLALAGCTGSTTPAAPTSEASDVRVDAMDPVTDVDAPTEAFDMPTDKHILILSCGNSGQGCVNEANESKQVAESLGWTVDLVDGKLDPTVWNQVVKQAAQTGVDGIISVSADPNLMADAMQIVADEDIPFVVTSQVPTDQDVAGIDTYIAPDPMAGGEDVADWIIADSGGEANVLLLDLPGFYSAMTRTAAIADTLAAACPDCEVQAADIAVQTMGTSLAPLVTSRLQQDPDIDYVWTPDDCCLSFVYQGIQQAGRTSDVKVVSTGGYPTELSNVASGQLAADQATATLFQGWMSLDALGRLMAGVPSEQYWVTPQRIWTSANIDEAPESLFESGYTTDLDYQAMFKELWGVE